MRFDSAADVEEVCWDMRLTDLPRAEDRATLLRLYNGNAPYTQQEAEDNQIQVNMNDLSGPNVLIKARTQWNSAHLKPSRFFTAKPESGPAHKRSEWSYLGSNHANRLLKADRRQVGLIRGQGANTMLFGIGPSNWKDRRSVIPTTIPVGSLLIPSETEIDNFEDDVSYFAVFREWSPSMLWDMTHGPKTDPGWNMELVQAQWEYIKDELRKSPNSTAFQYMPERIEELMKQDKGYMGTDAVPTCDVWDFYFREAENGKGWYRRVILDWDVGLQNITKETPRSESRNKVKGDPAFLYSSGDRKYANSLSEIIHLQFGDCSPYAPVKYRDSRGLGWLMWGVCELQNRLHCKFNEAVFEQLMWFFQTASNTDLIRLKKANFEHMGVIPQGIKFLTAGDRYTPNWALIQGAFERNKELMTDSSTSFTQGYQKGTGEGRTATETMAIVNSAQSLASGVLDLSYTYQKFLYMEQWRRLCLKHSTDPMAREFQKCMIHDDVPPELVYSPERWSIEPEQVIGGGNKTLQMATVSFLNNIRKNLAPAGQRIVDHMSVEAATDQPSLAEEIAPLAENQPISNSMHDAQLATDRLLRGMPYTPPKDAILEDYVKVWIHDLSMQIQKINGKGGMATPDELAGLENLGKTTGMFLAELAKNPDEKPKLKEFEDGLGKLMNHVKGFEQRLQAAMKKQAGANGGGQGDGKAQAAIIMAQTKAKIAANSAQQRTAQKQQQWEAGERRKDLQTTADLQREGVKTRHELLTNRLRALSE